MTADPEQDAELVAANGESGACDLADAQVDGEMQSEPGADTSNDASGEGRDEVGSEGDVAEGVTTETAAESDEYPKQWYILKVQVNREDSIRDALLRRVKIEGLEELFEQVVVPTEDVAEFTKTGKRRVVKKKLFPGYLMVHMHLNDDSWFLVRETPGIGDFTGSAGKPTPMLAHEVDKIIKPAMGEIDEGSQIRTAIPFKGGDRIRVKDGYFQNFEGDVESVDEAHGRITVMINIFGRPTPVELEHWQVEAI